MKQIILFSLLILLATGCAATVSMEHTAPPKAGAPRVNRVTVMPFADDRGDYVSSTLAAMLSELKYQGGAAYMVLDRSIMQEILSEQQFQMTLADPNTAMEFGQLVGIEAGFTGGVLYNQSFRSVQEERTKTVTTRIKRPDNKTETISRTESYYVTCNQNDYSMTVNLKLTDYSTTQIIYGNSISRTLSTKACPDTVTVTSTNFPSDKSDLGTESIQLTALAPSNDPYVRMANNILTAVAKDLGEYTLNITAEIAKKDKTLREEDQDTFKNAVEYLENGNLDRACEIWNDLYVSNKNSPYLTFNLGLCQELGTHYEEALNLYGQADRLLGKSDSLIQDAIDRIRLKMTQGIQ